MFLEYKMKYKISLPLTLAIFLVGCATKPVIITLYNKFDANSARALLEKGDNTIIGSAVLRQRDGGVQTCAGYEVWLIPRTEYAAERMQHLYGDTTQGFRNLANAQRYEFVNDSPDYQLLRKTTVCNAQGFFKFRNVAGGSFFVIAAIRWETFSPYSYVNLYTGQQHTATAVNKQGGTMMRRVTVSDGETKEIVLTQ